MILVTAWRLGFGRIKLWNINRFRRFIAYNSAGARETPRRRRFCWNERRKTLFLLDLRRSQDLSVGLFILSAERWKTVLSLDSDGEKTTISVKWDVVAAKYSWRSIFSDSIFACTHASSAASLSVHIEKQRRNPRLHTMMSSNIEFSRRPLRLRNFKT